jgi:uncharacterized membrane protein
MKLKPALLILAGLAMIIAACAAPTPEPNSAPTLEPTNTSAPLPTDTVAPPPTETAAPVEPTATPEVSGVSFANDILPILQNRCFNCHGGEETKEGLNLGSYATLMAGSDNGPVVVAGDAANSLLAQQLLNGKMPKRGPKLTPTQIQLIIDWINAGALNN